MKFNVQILCMIVILVLIGSGNISSAIDRQHQDNPITLKLLIRPKPTTIPIHTVIPGGTLQIRTALMHLGEITLESDNDDSNDAEDDEGMEDDEEDTGAESGRELEIEMDGATVDMSCGEAPVDSSGGSSGVYRFMDMEFKKQRSAPFNGASIFLEGTVVSADGISMPFTLRSRFNGEIVQRIPSPLILRQETETAAIVVDFNRLFKGVDMLNAESGDRGIVIDRSMNTSRLTIFETNLHRAIKVMR